MHDFSTLVDLLRYRAQHQPNDTAFIFLQDGEVESDRLTFQDLDRKARAIATHLQQREITNERALLLYPPNLEFISAFFGCLYARVVPVPAYPPRANQNLTRLEAVIHDAQAKLALTTAALQPNIAKKLAQEATLQGLYCIATDTLDAAQAGDWHCPDLARDTLAFLQYTSGSTGSPKGVMVSHGNLLHNAKLIHHCFQNTSQTPAVSWLPPYHDMGLIGGIIEPIYVGLPMTILPPVTFLQRPFRWLQAISRTRATTSGAPNFAYDLCVQQVKPEQKQQLDLSCWELAFSGAEPVRAETLDRFAAAFAPCGFRRSAFYPCYGMAEATLFAAGGDRTAAPILRTVCEQELTLNRVVAPSHPEQAVQTLVSSGCALPEQRIIIAHPETKAPLPPTEVGEIWVAGPSIAQGYWGQAEKTAQTFQAVLADATLPPDERGPWLRTGDLGFLQDGELYVTGRHKDLIIIRGRNHYPQDIETTVENSHPVLRQGAGAAFSLEHEGEERLVITQEVQRSAVRKLDAAAVTQAIRTAVANQHQLQPWRILLLRTGSIPKTSSGKIQRFACRNGVLMETLSVVGEWCEPDAAVSRAAAVQQPEPHAPVASVARSGPASALAEAIQEWLVHNIAQLLGVAPSAIDVQAPFTEVGLSSMSMVRLSGDLQDWLGQSLSPTLAYDYPTIAALAGYLGQLTTDVPDAVVAFAQPRDAGMATDEIAIIGMGCRFPGAETPEAFWQMLCEGKDAIREVRSRWSDPNTPCWGGFLDDIDQFDAQFFGISPREAEQMDPQQRLLLEVGWEALEDAGLPRERLLGSATGVFIGMSSTDYAQLQQPDLEQLSPYTGTGNAHSIAANRLSYLLDLRGPSLTVDTACSSSLVAVHLACQSIRLGECEQALAGGVNLILSPVLSRSFSQAGMLAADGRCKTFDQGADGYVRGEGCGVVVLKRLSQAQADGDPVLAVVRGSAVNQDGRSNGLTAPNGLAQQAVIRQALEQAQVQPEQIDYVDAHGTGTSLGDPIEMNALQAVLQQDRALEDTCWIGSVKTNIGHLEAAAGIAGLIKVVQSLRHREIPPHLHLQQVNGLIDLENRPFGIPCDRKSWPTLRERRLAGVSSFGFGGTNAHVILEAAPETGTSDEPTPELPLYLFMLSAKTQPALAALVQRYGDYLATNSTLSLADLCWQANQGRSMLEHRVAIATPSLAHLRKQLQTFGTGRRPPLGDRSPVLTGKASTAAPIAFLFTGQGCQYLEMGYQLYQSQPLFRDLLNHCDQILRQVLDYSLIDVLYPQLNPAPAEVGHNTAFAADIEPPERLDQTACTQPALFALEYALCKLWQSWGIQPTAVMGHSVGEYVAACIAGVFSLEEGLQLIAARARLMQALPQEGAMVAILAPWTQVEPRLAAYRDAITVAAYNGPEHFVVSGQRGAMDALVADLTTAGINMRWLRVSHAFHSPLMAPMLDAFRQVAAGIRYRPPQLPLISNLTGALATDEIASPDYWCQHILEPVQFQSSLETLRQQGCEIFLEIGPKPILLGMGRRCLTGNQEVWLPSLHPRGKDLEQLFQSLGQLFVQGHRPHWAAIAPAGCRSYLPLPTYPWQRQPYWFPAVGQATAPPPESAVVDWLNRGDTEQLVDLVAQGAELPVTTQKLLPTVMATLVEAHRRAQGQAVHSGPFYQVDWHPQPLPAMAAAPLDPTPGLWVLVIDPEDGVPPLAAQLVGQQQVCWCISRGPRFQAGEAVPGVTQWRLDPTQPDHWAQLWSQLPSPTVLPWKGILYWGPAAMASPAVEVVPQQNCQVLLALLHSLLREPAPLASPPKLWMVTQDAVGPAPPRSPGPAVNLGHAPLWGLANVIAWEHPQLWGGLIDTSTTDLTQAATQIVAELGADDTEALVAWRGQQRYVARLQAVPVATSVPSSACCTDAGTYLITGGLGALGLQIAQWLVQQGARALILVGRRLPSPKAQAVLQPLREQGVAITTVAVDICDRNQLPELETAIKTAPAPLKGVIHAAGVLEDATLQNMTWASFHQVLAPKTTGSWYLHQVVKDEPLDFFILFSSAAALLGSPGQGNYAAANAFMDALAHWRQQQGLPALSINWGPWAQVGMAAQLADRNAQGLATAGIAPLSIDQGLDCLGQLIQRSLTGTGATQMGVLSAQWSVLQQYVPTQQVAFLSAVISESQSSAIAPPAPGAESPSSPSPSDATSALFRQLIDLEPQQRAAAIATYLRHQIAYVLHRSAEDLDLDENLLDSGMDSLNVMDAINQLQRDLDLMVYPREFYERPRIQALADYLADAFEQRHGSEPDIVTPAVAAEDIMADLEQTPLLLNYATPGSPEPPVTQDRLPGIIFILSSPRSGSTLLRVMLGGHPHLLSTPELHLLPFETMAERAKTLSLSHLGEGLQRVLMELKGLGVKASQSLIQDFVNRGLSIRQVYAMLQDAAGSRLLVDKSPTYAMSMATLGRAEQLFTDAKYIHLVRHPYAMIESFVRMRMDKLLGVRDCNPYQLAESIWIRSNQNVLQFCQSMGSDRHHLIRYEDLVTEPTKVMEQLCTFLGVSFHPSVLQPYEGQRMTDGVHDNSLSLGDPNFLKHKGVEKTLGDAWKKIKLPHQLGNFARTLTTQLGYELLPHEAAVPPANAAAVDVQMRETVLSIRGLDLTLCHWGPDQGPLVVCLHGILDQGLIWEPLAQRWAAQGYHVIAPDLRGHGQSAHGDNAYQLMDYLADLEQLVPRLTSASIHLVGHSMGSVIAALYTSLYPHQVVSLSLLETVLPAEHSDSQDPKVRLKTQLDYRVTPPRHAVLKTVDEAAERLQRGTPSLDLAFARRLAQRATQPCEGGVQWGWDPVLRTRAGVSMQGMPLSRTDYLKVLAEIERPILLIYGDHSQFNRAEDLAAQRAALPQAQRHVLPGGHNIHVDAIAAVAQIVLAGLSQGSETGHPIHRSP